MGTEHTSGPWEYSEGADGEYRIYAGVFPGASRAVFDVADVWLPDRGDRAANGRLIAAAPDLYAAVFAWMREHDNTYDGGPMSAEMAVAISLARNALDKCAPPVTADTPILAKDVTAHD